MNDQAKFLGWDRYPVTKLLTIYAARELSKLATDQVVVTITNPGMARTELDRQMAARNEIGYVSSVFQLAFGRSAWSASQLLLFPLLVDEQAAYLDSGKVSEQVLPLPLPEMIDCAQTFRLGNIRRVERHPGSSLDRTLASL